MYIIIYSKFEGYSHYLIDSSLKVIYKNGRKTFRCANHIDVVIVKPVKLKCSRSAHFYSNVEIDALEKQGVPRTGRPIYTIYIVYATLSEGTYRGPPRGGVEDGAPDTPDSSSKV